MSVNTVRLRHNEARTALDNCASYLNVSMRVIESYIRQVRENPCPLTCDKISETADKVTSVAAIQQEIFKVYLDGWGEEDTIQILAAENVDAAATKLSAEAAMKEWFTRCAKVTTDASKAVKTAWNSLGPTAAREISRSRSGSQNRRNVRMPLKRWKARMRFQPTNVVFDKSNNNTL